MPVDLDLVIDALSRDVLDLEDDVAMYKLLLSEALTQAHAAMLRHQALQRRFEDQRDELRAYVRMQVTL